MFATFSEPNFTMIKRKLSQFNFDLPEELLADRPAANRDESRLMIVDRSKGTFEHKMFKDVINYFVDGDVMIFNNTKVFLHVCTETRKKQVLV